MKSIKILFISLISIISILFGFATVYSNQTFYKNELKEIIHINNYEQLIEDNKLHYNDNIYLENDILINELSQSLGSIKHPYEGVFDGKGYTITISQSDVSFFGYLSKNAYVKNLSLIFENVETLETSLGLIANLNEGRIENCKIICKNMRIYKTGIYSFGVSVNKGNISHIIVEGEFEKSGNIGDYKKSIIFGGIVGLNNKEGIIKSIVSNITFKNIEETKIENIYKNDSNSLTNLSIGSCYGINNAIKDEIIDLNKESTLFSLIDSHTYTVDKNNGYVIVYSKLEELYIDNNIYGKLSFSYDNWENDGCNYYLKRGIE